MNELRNKKRREAYIPKLKPLPERFWSRVGVGCENECWNWMRGTNGRYGMFAYRGTVQVAHRWAWKLSKGEIPENTEVCHKCDNTRCCNPNHLFLGTHTDNMRDAHAKKRFRSRKGENNPAAKLNPEDVLIIRAGGHLGCTYWARRYGMTKTAMSEIILRRTWTHI